MGKAATAAHRCVKGPNKRKILVNRYKIKILSNTPAEIPQDYRGIWLLALHAMTAHLVITYYHFSHCWLIIKSGEKKYVTLTSGSSSVTNISEV